MNISRSTAIIYSVLITSLQFLWSYAAASKLLDYERTRLQMLNQVFPASIAEILAWAVPATALLVCALLLRKRTRRMGLVCSAGLLVIFSLYILLVLLNIFKEVPCSCGGVIGALSWRQHLVFNLFLLALTLLSLRINKRKGGAWITNA